MHRVVLSLALLLMPAGGWALQGPQLAVRGIVTDPTAGVVSDVTLRLTSVETDAEYEAVSRYDGTFRFDGLGVGRYRLHAVASGFAAYQQELQLGGGDLDVELSLSLATVTQTVDVRAEEPSLPTWSTVPASALCDTVSQDVAETLRQEAGLSSVRRGSINLEPTVRGLSEHQVAMLVDGTRTFAAGPGRMDSDISHVSPSSVSSIQLVKGPYALTWGAGAMSAIQLQTARPDFEADALLLHGAFGVDYAGNGDRTIGRAGIWGSDSRTRFMLQHSTRIGNDFTDGDGTLVQGDYESFDTRWALGFQLRPDLTLDYSGGYQRQRDIDYPGLVMDALFFDTQSHAVDLSWRPAGGRVSEMNGQIYVNLKDHSMNNDNKPTAQPVPGRMPPFGLEVQVPTESNTYGGRFYTVFDQGAWEWKLGLDGYENNQNAERTIARRDDGRVMFHDIVWPDARIRDVGLYAHNTYRRSATIISGSLRLDAVDASAGEVSDFFLRETEGDLDQNEKNVSAALSVTQNMSDTWWVSSGIGRVVRTATALERYSDRFPSTKFQSSAEFMGNPSLLPEKSLQLDAGTGFLFGRTLMQTDIYFRTIRDYITVELDDEIPKQLPLSPPNVYRYVNGPEARFWGYELSVTDSSIPFLDLRGTLAYVWGKDELFDEPVFGIPPVVGQLVGRLHDGTRRWVELGLTLTGAQDRVATSRLERPTPGWTTLDARAGYALSSDVDIRAGILNLTNTTYTTHLNAIDPFSGARIRERGRALYVGIDYEF